MNDIRNNNFNFLRLLFATLVIIGHSPELIDGNRNREILTLIFQSISLGELAVDGFFILSGYLIVQSWHMKPIVVNFLKNRILRIFPAFIVASIISVFIIGAIGADNGIYNYYNNINIGTFIKDIFMLHVPKTPPIFHGYPYAYINGSMWTINYEFKCYLLVMLFGFLGFISNKKYWIYITIGMLLLFLISKIILLGINNGVLINDINYINNKYNLNVKNIILNPFIRLSSFFLIGGCHYLFKEKININNKFIIYLIIITFFGMFSEIFTEVILVITGGFLLFKFAFANINSLKIFQILPDISYGVYLYAWPIQKLLIFLIPNLSPRILSILTFIICSILGYLSWNLLEKQFMKLKKINIIHKYFYKLSRK